MRVHTLFALCIQITYFSFCTNVKINFREKEKEVLDQILGPGRYDARIRPSGVNGTDGPAIVQVNLFVRSIATISDIKMVSGGPTISVEDTCEIVSEGDSILSKSTQDSDAEGTALLVDATVDELSAPFSIDAYSSPSTSRSASAASSNRELKQKVTIQSNANKLQTQSKLGAKKKRKLEDEEYAGILKDCSTAINMLSRPASPPRVEPDNDNENSLFGKYITSEMNKINDDDILDEFKENVMRELYAAKKLFRQQLN
ncbi:hypothetical protein JTB14_021042 [Gonioctena quinquepunctata]|nr:hypothetical protein JTB14_021042 [Gonioctena quinquepunctata]